MIIPLLLMGLHFAESWGEAHFAKHGAKPPSASKQSTAIAVIGDALNASNTAAGGTPEALPANLADLIDFAVAMAKQYNIKL